MQKKTHQSNQTQTKKKYEKLVQKIYENAQKI